MNKPKELDRLFGAYAREIDAALKNLFETNATYDMYRHLAYFMGFSDEHFNPTQIYGGKRFRSSVALMIADWYGVKSEIFPAALSLELFHNFTLIHGDIVDNDELRRGRKTVWNIWGIPHAINDGDAQMILACEAIFAHTKNPEKSLMLLSFLLPQYRKVIEGQHLDFELTARSLDDAFVTESRYFEMIGRKTADLIAAATGSTGCVVACSQEERGRLFSIGYNLGIAYQLCDDTISIWEDASVTGKKPHNDLYERKKTAPILYAYGALPDSGKQTLVHHFSNTETLDDVAVQECITLLDSVNAYQHTRTHIDAYRTKTKEAIMNVSLNSEQKDILGQCVDALLPQLKRG